VTAKLVCSLAAFLSDFPWLLSAQLANCEPIDDQRLEQIYNRWRPIAHRNVAHNYRELDRLSLSMFVEQAGLADGLARFLGGGTPGNDVRVALQGMLTLRHDTLQLVRDGRPFERVKQSFVFLARLSHANVPVEGARKFIAADKLALTEYFLEHRGELLELVKSFLIMRAQSEVVQPVLLGLRDFCGLGLDKGLLKRLPMDGRLAFRMIRDYRWDSPRLLRRALTNMSLFPIAAVLAMNSKSFHCFSSREEKICYTLFAMRHKMPIAEIFSRYEALEGEDRRLFGNAVSEQLILADRANALEHVVKFFRSTGAKLLRFQLTELVNEDISVVRRALPKCNWLTEDLLRIIQEPGQEAAAFGFAVLGRPFPIGKTVGRVRKGREEFVMVKDKLLELPFREPCSLLPPIDDVESACDVELPPLKAPMTFRSRFQAALTHLSDPISYFILNAFPNEIMPFGSTGPPESYHAILKSVMDGYESQSNNVYVSAPFHRMIRISPAVSNLASEINSYLIMSGPIYETVTFTIESFGGVMYRIGIIPNYQSSVLRLHPLVCLGNDHNGKYTLKVVIEKECMKVGGFSLPKFDVGSRVIVFTTSCVDDGRKVMRVTGGPELRRAASSDTPLLLAFTDQVFQKAHQLSPYLDGLTCDRLNGDAYELILSVLLDRLCRTAIGIRLQDQILRAKNDKMMSSAPREFDWARFFSILAIHHETVNFGHSYPFHFDIAPEMHRLWAVIPNIDDKLRGYVLSTCGSVQFHRAYEIFHGRILCDQRKVTVHHPGTYVLFAATRALRVWVGGTHVRRFPFPFIVHGGAPIDIEVEEGPAFFICVPTWVEWIYESPFELLVLVKYMYRLGPDRLALFAKSRVLLAFIHNYHFIVPFLDGIVELFTGDLRSTPPLTADPSYEGYVSWALECSQPPSLFASFLQREKEQFIQIGLRVDGYLYDRETRQEFVHIESISLTEYPVQGDQQQFQGLAFILTQLGTPGFKPFHLLLQCWIGGSRQIDLAVESATLRNGMQPFFVGWHRVLRRMWHFFPAASNLAPRVAFFLKRT
jgi:hypothetical protein